ncbi:unnamed protein product, partial [Nesidiocoris tenuis]
MVRLPWPRLPVHLVRVGRPRTLEWLQRLVQVHSRRQTGDDVLVRQPRRRYRFY